MVSSNSGHNNIDISLAKLFRRYKNMNSSFVAISSLIKNYVGENCLINILINISSHALRDYLECANIYNGTTSKKKTNLIEMIVYGCITDKLSKNVIEDISKKRS